jgi:hypothetical protein
MSPSSARFRLRFRLRVRLRFRLRCRLRFPSSSAGYRAFPCAGAGSRAPARFDISVLANHPPAADSPVPLESRRLALRQRANPALLPWADPAVARRAVPSPVGDHVTCRCRRVVPLAYRVVAGRRRLYGSRARRSPAQAFPVLPASAGLCCAALPTLSRRLAGRWCNGKRRAAPPPTRGGAW